MRAPWVLATVMFGCSLLLAGCATQPTHINNACSVFQQKGGWFNNWYRYAHRTQKKYGVPVPVLMATIYKESAYDAHAKPPRTHLLGFIPWKRPSDAYGYAQALSSTWATYEKDTGRHGADRNDFDDAIDFIGWYHHQSHVINGIPLNDAYHLYLAYYVGHGGYANGSWKHNAHVKRAASRVAAMSRRYAAQLRDCDL